MFKKSLLAIITSTISLPAMASSIYHFDPYFQSSDDVEIPEFVRATRKLHSMCLDVFRLGKHADETLITLCSEFEEALDVDRFYFEDDDITRDLNPLQAGQAEILTMEINGIFDGLNIQPVDCDTANDIVCYSLGDDIFAFRQFPA